MPYFFGPSQLGARNYEVVVERKYVPAEILKLLDGEPVGLPPWDPMGALASAS